MEERRTFLKRTGLVLLGLAGSTALGPGLGRSTTRKQPRPAMIIDVNRCMGCQSCVIACKEQNLTPKGYFNTRIETIERGSYPVTWKAYRPDLCHHCENAPCVKVCATEASFQLTSGLVMIDWDKCTGDGACVDACPYNSRFLDPDQGNKADKCDFCLTRLTKGLEPACVESCPSHARIFGDLEDPQLEFATYLEQITSTDAKIMKENKERLFYTRARRN